MDSAPLFDLLASPLFAAEPWFNANLWGWLPGTLYGAIGGGLGGSLIGTLAPQGKAKAIVLGWCYGCTAIAAGFLITAIVAIASGQPYGVWYGLLLPGILGLILFPMFIPMVHQMYRHAEQRRLEAQNL